MSAGAGRRMDPKGRSALFQSPVVAPPDHLEPGAEKRGKDAPCLSEATVKVHLKSILKKLRVTNRTQAAIWAVNNGVDANAACATVAAEAKPADDHRCRRLHG